MIDIKADFSGGLNLDDSLYDVPKSSYIDAMNVTTDAIEGSNDRAITNIVGNISVFTSLPAGRNKCIGACANNVRNTVIYFIWNENGYHSIFEYNNENGEIKSLFQNLTQSDNIDVLGFLEDKKITSVNIYNRNPSLGEGDLLFFLDSLGRPTTMDIERFRNEEYSPVTRDILDVCKKPPLFPPDVLYNNDATRNINNLRNRLFRFKYRYVYDNNEKSVCSPISTLPLPINILDEEYSADQTKNNNIALSLNTGDKDVKSIELLMSYVLKTNDWSDFALVENINKSNLVFLNSSVITEDNLPGSNVKATIKFEGFLIPATVVNIVLVQFTQGFPEYTVGTYTIQEGDSMTDLTSGLVSSLALNPSFVSSPSSPTSNTVEFYYDFPYSIRTNGVEIILPANPNVDNVEFLYSFYNDGTYPVIDVAESTQLFDYVPDLANAQEMANGNVLLYGGITEGYDKDIVPNVVNDILTYTGGVTTAFIVTYQNLGGNTFKLQLKGIPSIGTIIKLTLTYGFPPIPAPEISYTITSTDYNTILLGLKSAIISQYPYTIYGTLDIQNNNSLYFDIEVTFGFIKVPILYVNHSVVSNITNQYNSIPAFLFSTTRKLGIAYFDKKGKTNGILYNSKLDFPNYNENNTDEILLPFVNTKIYHTPPDWAYSYGFYLTKEATQFLYWVTPKIAYNTPNTCIYIDISNIGTTQSKLPTKAAVINYNFQDGDRVRLIKKLSGTTVVYPQIGDYDVAILGVVKDPTDIAAPGTFIKINKVSPFDTVTFGSDLFLIQIYRPTQQLPNSTNEVYYEFGQQYGIGNPSTPTRCHLGMVSKEGKIPNDLIKCTVSTLVVSNENTATLSFSGTPLAGTNIVIYINDPSQIKLADYTIQINDTIEDVVNELALQLGNYVGTYLLSLISFPTKIDFTYLNTIYSFSQSDVVFTYPSASDIPATFNFYGGDVYLRERQYYLDASTEDVITVLDRNFVDDYISAVNNIDGRPSVIEVDARKAYYATLVRFGQAYQANTNINGLNRFFPANFDEYDYTYGDIMRLKVRDRFVRVFQKLKIGKVPLYAQIVKDPANAQNLIVSDKLINPIQYYVGDLGIGEHAESLASYNYADYFTSNIKGIVGRISESGIEFISLVHKMDSWATSNLPLRTGNYKVYGGIDQRIGNYIIALEATNTDPATTLVYDMDLNIFSTFLSYHPEMMVTLGTLFISFKDGQLYTHDNPSYNTFFGTSPTDSYITPVFNANPLDKKTFMSVGEVASQIWDVPEAKTDINSYANTKMETNLVDADFVELEGTYEAAILRDKNSTGGVLEGDSMKGKYMTMKFRAKAPTSLVSLNLLSLKSINSPLNNR